MSKAINKKKKGHAVNSYVAAATEATTCSDAGASSLSFNGQIDAADSNHGNEDEPGGPLIKSLPTNDCQYLMDTVIPELTPLAEPMRVTAIETVVLRKAADSSHSSRNRDEKLAQTSMDTRGSESTFSDRIEQLEHFDVNYHADHFGSPSAMRCSHVLTAEEERQLAMGIEAAFLKLNSDAEEPRHRIMSAELTNETRLLYDVTMSTSGSHLACVSAATPNLYRRRASYALKSQKSFKKSYEQPPPKKLILFALSMVNLTAYLSMSILAPFFPYEASLKGMTSSSSGFVFSIYALVIMIASPILGKALPYVGVKFMLLAGIWFAGWANVLFGFVGLVDDTMTFIYLCYIVRSVSALGEAAFMTASYTYIIQLFPDNIGLAFGITETCVGVGMSIGPAVGGLLYGVGGYGLPFYVLGAFVLVNMPLCWYVVNPIESELFSNHNSSNLDDSSVESPATYLRIIKNPKVLLISLVLATATSAQSFLDPTVEPHFREYGLTPQYVGLIFLVMSGAYALSSPLIGWFAGKEGVKSPLMLIGLLVTAVGYLLLGPSDFIGLDPSLWLSSSAMVILGLAYSLAFIPTFEAILDTVVDSGAPDDVTTYSLVSGWWSSVTSLGEVAGSAIGGVFLDLYGFNEGTDIIAIWTLATALVFGIGYLIEIITSSSCHGGAPLRKSDQLSLASREQTPLLRGHYAGHRCPRCQNRNPFIEKLVAYQPRKSNWRRSILQTI